MHVTFFLLRHKIGNSKTVINNDDVLKWVGLIVSNTPITVLDSLRYRTEKGQGRKEKRNFDPRSTLGLGSDTKTFIPKRRQELCLKDGTWTKSNFLRTVHRY